MSRKKIVILVIIFTMIIIGVIIVLNPSHKYNKLSLSEEKWDSIKESRIENTNLVLRDIRSNDYRLIIDEKNNTLYYSLVNDSANKYNPKVEYDTNNKDAQLVILSDEITDEKVKNNYEFKIMIYNEKEYHIYNLKCTDLPILNFHYNEKIEKKNIAMEMYLFDNLSNVPNKITISRGKIKADGENYIFSLHMLTPGKNKRDNRISLLNMRPSSQYILTEIDNEDLTENGYDLKYKNQRVELFLNNEYKGVYSVDYVEGINQISY